MPADEAVSVREADERDLAAIVALYEQDELHRGTGANEGAGAESYRTALSSIRRDPNNFVYVAELREEVIGTFQLTFIQQLTYGGAVVAQIESVFVRRDHRARGVGTRMLRWAIARAEQRGCRRVQLTSNLQRSGAHAFYERLGFSATHRGFKLTLPA